MPFGYPEKDIPVVTIDYTKSRPVSVMTVFNPVGEFKPLKFHVQVEDESYQTYNVESIKYTKELKGRTSFCCVFLRDGLKQDVILTYYFSEHRWRIES